MPSSDIETVRHLYDLWRDGAPAALDLFRPDAELHPDPGSDWPGVEPVYYSAVGAMRYMASIGEAFDDYRPDVEEIIDAGDGIVVTLAVESGRGKSSGITTTRQTAHLWTIRDGAVARLDVIWDRDEALARAGLARREGVS